MPDINPKQSDWILSTKLNPPLIRADIVNRPQLLSQLERDVNRSLTLIAAPAGYGKSTLAAQWLEASSLPGVWVSLDEADNDLRIFISYIVAAVRRIAPNSCTRIYDLLDAPRLPPPDILAKLLANDFEEIELPFLLVLDDYHLMTETDIHDLLNRLLQHPPRSLHLVIVTRRDPPFPLVKMKACGQAAEIRESDLQFDATETEHVLEKVGAICLDEQGLGRVMQEIEGWITGLRLFCLALSQGGDPQMYLFGLSGRAIQAQDYLIDQVLSHQLPEIQECLLKTSILDRFSGPLCEAICKIPQGKDADKLMMDGRKFMDILTEEKLFGIHLEPSSEWIRYHHLFRDLLYNRLQRKWDPKDIAALHGRAARWFAGKGLIEEGLKHAKAAGDSEMAACIIEDARLEALNTDKWPRLAKWLDGLPPDIENNRPHLLMCRAYVLMQSLRIAEITEILNKIVKIVGSTPSEPMIAGELAFFRGIVCFFTGEITESKHYFAVALSTLPNSNIECRAEAEYFSYVVIHIDGKHKKAVQSLQAAIQRNKPHSPFYKTRLVFGLSFVHALAGHWPDSLNAAIHLMEFTQPKNLSYALAWSHYMQGNASLQMANFQAADRAFATVFEMRYMKNLRAVVDALAGYALSLQFQGRLSEAEERLNEATEFAYWTGDPLHLDVVESCRARIALLRGNKDAACRWQASCQDKPDLSVKLFFLEYPQITICRVLVSLGTKQCLKQATSKLEMLESESRQFHHDCQLVPVLVLKSLLSLKDDRRQEAMDILAEAVDLSWTGRWILPFIEGGQTIVELLKQLPSNPIWGGFVSQVVAHHDSHSPLVEHNKPTQGFVDDTLITNLTNRETDVMVLLCDRMYDKEIADRLAISTATVKTHLTRIYRKLGVANRREAATKAKQHGLV